MGIMKKKTEPAAAMVVALTSGTIKVGGTPYTFRRGDKLRHDHPLARAHRAMFAPDGLTTAEYEQAAHAYRVAAGASGHEIRPRLPRRAAGVGAPAWRPWPLGGAGPARVLAPHPLIRVGRVPAPRNRRPFDSRVDD
jgi:hypothetical protein